MTTAAEVAKVLDALFPPGVVVAVRDLRCQEEAHLWSEERDMVPTAGPKRRREFLAGRACAHEALRALGCDSGPIAIGPNREPLWPPGSVGSISHGGAWAAAAVARAEDFSGIGVDIEPLEPPLEQGVERMVHTAAELQVERTPHPLTPFATKISFSAKESMVKCLFSATGRLVALTDIAVDLDLGGSRLAADVHAVKRGGSPASTLPGAFDVADGHVFTAAWVGPELAAAVLGRPGW
ncbi:MAG TPA: 4'-phosphopantetheinyl transferase superfamily protein [Acidimicrobiales bacterium]|nr:4'-phosphopantetheinyl transferase superfamily protein [Acidimicrobiales bacterium]